MHFEKRDRGAFVNFLKAKLARLSGDAVASCAPYHLFLDPCSACQLRCRMCVDPADPSRRVRPPAVMGPELYDSLLDELGGNLFMLSLYNWGEPLLNPHLARFIERAKRSDIRVDINTNLAMKLSDDDIESFLRSGVDDIVVSIDGFSQETYGTYRIGGSFETARNNVARLAAIRDRGRFPAAVTWKYLVFAFNEHEIPQAERYCRDRGIAFARKEAIVDVEAHPDWLPSYRKGDLARPHGGWPFARSVAPDLAAAGREATCAWHYCYSAVNADGTVSPCCAVAEPKNDFGAVAAGKTTFSDVWNGDLFRRSRAILAGRADAPKEGAGPVCGRCPYPFIKDLCTGIDRDIISRFREVPAAAEPGLAEAFARLARRGGFLEYMAGAQSLLDPEGPAPPRALRTRSGEPAPERGACAVCGASTVFTLKKTGFSLRETACGACGASRRNRDVAAGILAAFGLDPDRPLALQADALSGLAVFEAQAEGPLHRVLRRLPGYLCAEFLDGVPPGGRNAAGVRCEDLERLTFPDKSLDLVITQDVFEHLPRPEAAFREIARVLKAGGLHIFTVPLHEGRGTAARARPGGRGTEHLLPPVYHGDPLRASGTLVYTDFGDDLPALLAPLGFATDVIRRETFYRPDELPRIDDAESHARYLECRRRGELLACLRYNSVVFRSMRTEAAEAARGPFREAMESLLAERPGAAVSAAAAAVCRASGEAALAERFLTRA